MVKTLSVCDFSRLAVTDWRLRRWRVWFLALMTATHEMNGRPWDHALDFKNTFDAKISILTCKRG